MQEPIDHRRSVTWPRPWIRWTIRLLALTATVTAGYLAWISLGSEGPKIGCGGLPGIGCQEVLSERQWAYWLGVPVSVPAVGVYALIFLASCLVGRRTSAETASRARWALVLLTILAAGSAIWFVGLLVFAVEGLCPYCLIVHTCGLTIAALTLPKIPLMQSDSREQWYGAMNGVLGGASTQSTEKTLPVEFTPAAVCWAGGLAVGGLTLLIGIQLAFPPATFIEESPDDVVSGKLDPETADVLAGGGAPTEPRESESPGTTSPQRPITRPQPPKERLPNQLDPSPGEAAQEPPSDPPNERPPVEDPDSSVKPALPGALSPESPTATTGHSPLPGGDPPPPSPRTKVRHVNLFADRFQVNTYGHPILGDPAAEHVVVKLFDYTCRHCRNLDKYLDAARTRYGDQLAIVVLPVPMNSKCNKYLGSGPPHPHHRNACELAQLGMAVWFAAPEKFEAYHHWLFEPGESRPVDEATEHAAELIGRSALRRQLAGSTIGQSIDAYTDLSRKINVNSDGGIPKLLTPSHAISCQLGSPKELFDILQRNYDLEPIDGGQ